MFTRLSKKEIECIEPVSSDKVPASRQKMKINEELQLHCEVCAKPYKRKSALEAHVQQKHGNNEKPRNKSESLTDVDRSKDNCPTCELPKDKGKTISCHKCKLNTHSECVAVDSQKLLAYKSGKALYTCESCYWDMDSPKSITLEESSKNEDVPIVIDEETEEEVDDVYKCKLCDFETKEEKQMEIHCLTLHLVKCDGCMMYFRNNQELENHCKNIQM